MADNVVANAGSGGATFATDDVAGVHYPIGKLAYGALDTATLVTGTVGLPVADAGGSLTVDVGTALPAGTNNIGDVDVLSLPASTNTLEVVGDAAHDAAIAGNPVRIGATAETSIESVTLVADGDTTNLYADLDGVLVIKSHATHADIISERVSNTDGASTALTNFAAVASTRNYLTTIVVHNAHATTNGYVDIRDGTAGAVLFTLPLPATGGTAISFPVPLRFTANTAVAFDVSAAITTVYLSFIGFQSLA